MTTRIAPALEGSPRTRHGWLILGLPILLAACAQVPEWSGKASLTQPVPDTLQATRNAPRMDWPTQQWWLAFVLAD